MTINAKTLWTTARLAGGVAIIVALLFRLGSDPFTEGLRRIDLAAITAALAVTAVTTLACAWRWNLIAGRLDLDIPVARGVAAYYRSQFLNATLPGGVLGDVDRAVSHGRDAGDLGRGARSVAWERGAGQAVQLALTAVVLLVLPSPLRAPLVPVLVVAVPVVALAGLGLARVSGELRHAVLARVVLPGVVLASAVAAIGHVVIFLVAARTAGVTAPLSQVLPIALIVLLASAVPLNIAGWGPREGTAAWAFGSAGLGATQGITVAVVYGVMAFAATLPGAVLSARRHRGGAARRPAVPTAALAGANHV